MYGGNILLRRKVLQAENDIEKLGSIRNLRWVIRHNYDNMAGFGSVCFICNMNMLQSEVIMLQSSIIINVCFVLE